MAVNENMRQVIRNIQLTKVDADIISPHYVADVANQLKIVLSSAEIVWISDNM